MNFFRKILSYVFDTSPEVFNLGALIDTRSIDEKKEDPHISEIVATSAVVTYKELRPDEIRVFGVQDQGSKSDCVAESRRKIKRILFKVNKNLDIDFSSVAFYRKRSNFPSGGMAASDAIALDANIGMTLNALVPSDELTNESMANALQPDAYNDDVAAVFRNVNKDVIFTPGDLDTPAATIQKTRKGVMMWFYFTGMEWSAEVPVIQDYHLDLYAPGTARHSVVGIEPALYKGQKGIWIDDSAAFGGLHRRFVTEDFYKARNWFASYPIAFKFEGDKGQRPVFKDGDIVSLQNCLKYEGVFPSNVDSTGVYGSITTQAVRDFQKKYGLEQVGSVGPLTKAKLVELYS